MQRRERGWLLVGEQKSSGKANGILHGTCGLLRCISLVGFCWLVLENEGTEKNNQNYHKIGGLNLDTLNLEPYGLQGPTGLRSLKELPGTDNRPPDGSMLCAAVFTVNMIMWEFLSISL